MVQKHVTVNGVNYILENNAAAAPPPAPAVLLTGIAALGPIAQPLAQATLSDQAFYGISEGNPATAEKAIHAAILAGRIRVFQ